MKLLKVRSKWNRRQFAAGLVALMMFFAPITGIGVAFATPPAATGDDPTSTAVTGNELGNIQNVACNAANIIRGPAGIAIGFLVVVGGIIALQIASRDAMPLIGRGIFGTALLLGAGAAFAAVVADPCTAATTSLPPSTIVAEAPRFEHGFAYVRLEV